MSSTETHNQHSQVQGIGPTVLSELNDCGIKNSTLTILLDMISPEDSGKVIEIISKMAKFHKLKFSIKLGIHNWIETTMKFDSKCKECEEPMPEGTKGLWLRGQGVKHIRCECEHTVDEHLQSSKNILASEYRPINDVYDSYDFQQRKEMREALRD